MGVEYQHWLLPADPSFRPGHDLSRKLHAVLEKYGLGGPHEIYDISAGTESPVPGAFPSATMPATALVRYDELVHGPSVERLVGTDEDEPYVQRRLVIVGSDQHVLDGNEELYVEVESPAVRPAGYRKGLRTSHWAPADATLSPVLHSEIPVPKTLTGVFRAAVVLDFGKSLPPFVLAAELGLDVPRALEDRDFVTAIEVAFGTPIIETGFLY